MDTGYYNKWVDKLHVPNRYRAALKLVIEFLETKLDYLEISELWLFGSMAREEIGYGSDIDILLVTSSENERDIRIKCCMCALDDEDGSVWGVPIQITVRRRSKLWNLEDYFQKTIYPDLLLIGKYTNLPLSRNL